MIFTEVTPTPEEMGKWRERHPGLLYPTSMRVVCSGCGKRLWAHTSGLRSHQRVCKGES